MSDSPETDAHVVVGSDAVVALRQTSPLVPVVALVPLSSPIQAVLAQVAGADVVLPTSVLEVGLHRDTPGLELALQTANVLGQQRINLANASRRISHDLSESLNVIALASEVGQRLGSGADGPSIDHVLEQIGATAREATAMAWESGRTYRSSRRSMTAVEVNRLIAESLDERPDVDLRCVEAESWIVTDEWQLRAALAEMVNNAKRCGADRVVVSTETGSDGMSVAITITDDGDGFSDELRQKVGTPFLNAGRTGRLGLGLATIAELVDDIGGTLAVSSSATGAAVVLTLPTLESHTNLHTSRATVVDLATEQANILEGVVRRAPLEESLEAIVKAIEQLLPDSICSVLLLRDGATLHHGAGARLPEDYRAAIDGVLTGEGQGSCGTAAFVGHPIVAADIETDANWADFRHLALPHGLRSCWSTPIVAARDGQVLGTFAVYKSTPWGPDHVATRLVERFTHLAAVAIEHHRLFDALAESEFRFRGAFEGAGVGMALVELDGTMQQVNPALCAMLGTAEVDVMSSNFLELVDPDYRERVSEGWGRLVQSGNRSLTEQQSLEVPFCVGVRSETLWVSLSTSIINPGGNDPYFHVEARDLTADRRQAAEQRAREAAEAANLAKSEVLAHVSHELRTPLNAILGFAQLMEMVDLAEEERVDSVTQILHAGRHLRDLVDELLDLSRIEAGALTLTIEELSASHVISDALDIVRPLATGKAITVVCSTADGDAALEGIRADRRSARQVLINLLGNAVKYTPAGGSVTVSVGSADGRTRISITDTGPGIDFNSQTELFQPFHRLGLASQSEGTGLGLALAARLMDEMGGVIGVDSTVGVGSCFWVEFPSALASGLLERRSTPGQTIVHRPTRGTVLYVEDDPGSVDLLARAMAMRPNIDLLTASSITEAMSLVQQARIDLVLLDIGLPDGSGWDLLDSIRSARPNLPAAVLTAGPPTVPASAPVPDVVFSKPIELAEVIGVIDALLIGGTREAVDLI